MSVSIALFTQDLRLHDNPVLRAALADADEVVPLFVLDDGVAATGFAVPNRSAFLAGRLADLDAGLRSRGGRLVLRRGPVVAETARLAAATGAVSVHVAAGVSGFAQRRESALREAIGDRLRVHDAVLTALAPGAVTPAGKDHYAVFTPYLRAWRAAQRRHPVAAPRTVRVPDDVPDGPLPQARPDSPGCPRAARAPAAHAGRPGRSASTRRCTTTW